MKFRNIIKDHKEKMKQDKKLCGGAEDAFDETIDETSEGIKEVENKLEKSMFGKSKGGNLEW